MFKFQCCYCLQLFKIEASDLGEEVQCPHCLEVVPIPTSRLERGNVLGDFVIQHKIATWERGKVYAALQLSLDRMIALKVLFPERASQPGVVDEFIQEARDEAKLDFPHAGQVFALGQDNGIFFSGLENVRTTDTNTTIFMREIVIQQEDFEEPVESEPVPERKPPTGNVKVAEPVAMPHVATTVPPDPVEEKPVPAEPVRAATPVVLDEEVEPDDEPVYEEAIPDDVAEEYVEEYVDGQPVEAPTEEDEEEYVQIRPPAEERENVVKTAPPKIKSKSGTGRKTLKNVTRTQGIKTKIRMPNSLKKGGGKTKIKIAKLKK